MAIPDVESLLLPLLELAGDGRAHPIGELREQLAQRLGLSEEERRRPLPSGRAPLFDNRVLWAAF